VQTQPVGEVPVAKTSAILVQQVVGHFELSVVDCFFNSLDRSFYLHLEPLFAVYVYIIPDLPIPVNQKKCGFFATFIGILAGTK